MRTPIEVDAANGTFPGEESSRKHVRTFNHKRRWDGPLFGRDPKRAAGYRGLDEIREVAIAIENVIAQYGDYVPAYCGFFFIVRGFVLRFSIPANGDCRRRGKFANSKQNRDR
jgi:hypothetical protein